MRVAEIEMKIQFGEFQLFWRELKILTIGFKGGFSTQTLMLKNEYKF